VLHRRAIFFVVTLIAAGSYIGAQAPDRAARQGCRQIRDATVLADPMVVAAGLQLVRTIGIKN